MAQEQKQERKGGNFQVVFWAEKRNMIIIIFLLFFGAGSFCLVSQAEIQQEKSQQKKRGKKRNCEQIGRGLVPG